MLLLYRVNGSNISNRECINLVFGVAKIRIYENIQVYIFKYVSNRIVR